MVTTNNTTFLLPYKNEYNKKVSGQIQVLEKL
jgi:hypothetical protein